MVHVGLKCTAVSCCPAAHILNAAALELLGVVIMGWGAVCVYVCVCLHVCVCVRVCVCLRVCLFLTKRLKR